VSDTHLTRRQVLAAMAAVPLLKETLEAQASTSSICFMSAMEMAAMIRAGKLSAREALAAHLQQIERVNPKVNAIVTLVAEMAADAAAKADEMQAHKQNLGPLHGLPVAHKDLFETRGIRTTFGSPLYKDYSPPKTISSSTGSGRRVQSPLARPTRRNSGQVRRRSTKFSARRTILTT
jgi:hypothetical protein